MKLFFTFLLTLTTSSVAIARESPLPISLSLFNNGTALPGTGFAGMFSRTIHPGITIGTYHLYHQKKKHELFQTLKLGYFYHRHAQHAVQIYSELGYRYLTAGGFYLEGNIGAGYLHSFADLQQFRLQDGVYKKKTNFGRPQIMASLSLAAGYDLKTKKAIPLRLFIQYQFWLQAPFVNKYVPLLPNSAVHIGAIYSLPKHTTQEKQKT